MPEEKHMNLNEFNKKLKRHLANDYLSLSERKTELESDLIHLRADKDRKDKKLFQTFGQNNVKKYFSPLNIDESLGKNNDEKLEQLKAEILRVEKEIKNTIIKLDDIQEFLTELDWLAKEISSKSKPIPEKKKPEEKIYPQLLKNLQALSEVYQEKYQDIDIILEFTDPGIELEKKKCKNIVLQLKNNIDIAINEYHATVILIQGNVNSNNIELVLSYMCQDESEDVIKVTYSIG